MRKRINVGDLATNKGPLLLDAFEFRCDVAEASIFNNLHDSADSFTMLNPDMLPYEDDSPTTIPEGETDPDDGMHPEQSWGDRRTHHWEKTQYVKNMSYQTADPSLPEGWDDPFPQMDTEQVTFTDVDLVQDP